MTKNKIIALTAGVFMTMASVLSIVSCNKEEQKVTATSTPGKASKISGTVDLEHFQTVFTNNPDGSQTITFSEAEDIPFLQEDAKALGFESLTIAKGVYEIIKDRNGKSKVTFALSTFSGKGEMNSVGIRIADRYKKKCGTAYGDFYCVCGIGFRCGIVHGLDEPMPAATFQASIYPEKDNNGVITGLTFEFQDNNMNWEAIDGIN